MIFLYTFFVEVSRGGASNPAIARHHSIPFFDRVREYRLARFFHHTSKSSSQSVRDVSVCPPQVVDNSAENVPIPFDRKSASARPPYRLSIHIALFLASPLASPSEFSSVEQRNSEREKERAIALIATAQKKNAKRQRLGVCA